ncbi:MAG: tRNA lysidine(34) synthetase TilS [Alphaproteobacteria bacterium]|nr:tRNA lysidine(34) synthetase TilS [Alphaproteobacteria bacterium]
MFELIRNKIKTDIIAVGVSGGADSLALALMLNDECKTYGIKVIALTVNHKLRPSAAKEAEYVAEIMQAHKIEHHILTWEGEKPSTGVEEAARLARYDLLREWCFKHNVEYLAVAHHLRDQAETFLMRLERGSGLEGLCSMREITDYKGLKIFRPLLHYPPEFMEDYLRKKNITWIHDESNDNTDFLRVKMRKFLPEMQQKTGIDLAKFDEAITNLQSAESYIEEQVQKEIDANITTEFNLVFSFKYSAFLRWHKEIKFRILANLLKKNYIPRADSVLELINALNKLPFTGATLGGKEIFLNYGRIWIVPEMKAKHKSSRKEWKEFVAQNPEYKDKKIPHKARLAILNIKENQ